MKTSVPTPTTCIQSYRAMVASVHLERVSGLIKIKIQYRAATAHGTGARPSTSGAARKNTDGSV